MTSVVIDSSVAVAWLMPDEQPDFLKATLENDAFLDCVAPHLFWFELRNVLLVNERRERLTPSQRVEALSLLSSLPIRLAELSDDAISFALARKHNLTFYDASYLALAIEEGASIATFDKRLKKAALAEGVAVLG